MLSGLLLAYASTARCNSGCCCIVCGCGTTRTYSRSSCCCSVVISKQIAFAVGSIHLFRPFQGPGRYGWSTMSLYYHFISVLLKRMTTTTPLPPAPLSDLQSRKKPASYAFTYLNSLDVQRTISKEAKLL